MTEFHQILQHLKQPEYVHVLLNPLPVYATGTGVLALVLALLLRSRHAQIVALVLIIVGCGSVWPVEEFGERCYDRVYSMSNSRDAQQWLDEHAHRADTAAPAFYVTAALALAAIVVGWKIPKTALPLAVSALVGAVVCLALGGWISHAGGQVRHGEFRDGPPPQIQTHPPEEHEH